MHVIPIVASERSCDGCTVCCQGWLRGKAHGHYFFPGRSCYFTDGNKCTIYETRPEIPCKTFKCGWLYNTEVPVWMKPSNIDAVLIPTNESGKFKQVHSNSLSFKIYYWIMTRFKQGKIKNTDKSNDAFLLEIKEDLKKYGQYLLLLDEKRFFIGFITDKEHIHKIDLEQDAAMQQETEVLNNLTR